MDLKLLNDQGQAATFSAPDTIFGRDFNEALIHQIVVAFQANARADVYKRQAYRETIRKTCEEVEGKFVKQSGGRGQYGHVVLKV